MVTCLKLSYLCLMVLLSCGLVSLSMFFVQVHSRPGLTDSSRMVLLQSHVKGDAKRLIQGLGYSGCNYAQTLKELKFAFGHRIKVAQATPLRKEMLSTVVTHMT